MINIFELFHNKIQEKSEIEIIGRIKSNRGNKKIRFLIINDGTSFNNIQIICKIDQLNNFSELNKYKISSIIKIKGKFCISVNKKQLFEIEATQILLLDQVNNDFPLQKKAHSFEFLRTIAHLRVRTNTFDAIFRIRSSCAFAIHEFFHKNNFIYINAPIITQNNSEGSGETFILTSKNNGNIVYNENFFHKRANLTVSGQLHIEGFAQVFQNVYTFGPAFRAENSNSTKHAAEFWMIEPEIAFNNLDANMNLAENMLKYVLNYILNHNLIELNFLNDNIDNNLISKLKKVISNPFSRISYTEGINILKTAITKNNYKFKNNNIFWGMNLQTEHERYLCEIYNNSIPIFLINYPKEIKAFYMKLNNDNITVAACDLLISEIGEIIGGSQRENDYQKIWRNYQKLNNLTNDLQWYLDLRKYGYYKSSGFGLGFERLIMYVTGMKNIRDVIAFPRTSKNLKF